MPPLLILIAHRFFESSILWIFFAYVNTCSIVVYLNSFVKSVTKHKKIESYLFFWGSVEHSWGWIMQCCRIVNVNQKQKHKKQPWGKVECFAFGGGTVRFASLETSFHAANHTVPPPPSYEGYPLCPKDKNRSPFHGEKPLMIT